MQWIKVSDHYPEGWQLGRVDGKKLPLMFAPHVIADVSGKTYKREQVEYFAESEPAPSPGLYDRDENSPQGKAAIAFYKWMESASMSNAKIPLEIKWRMFADQKNAKK